MIDRDFKPAFAVKHQQKDLAIVLKTSRENKLPLPGVALVHQLLTALEAEGRGDDGTQALYTLYERLGKRLVTTRRSSAAASWGSPPPISSSCASPA